MNNRPYSPGRRRIHCSALSDIRLEAGMFTKIVAVMAIALGVLSGVTVTASAAPVTDSAGTTGALLAESWHWPPWPFDDCEGHRCDDPRYCCKRV
jgi:hypothetical protein